MFNCVSATKYLVKCSTDMDKAYNVIEKVPYDVIQEGKKVTKKVK